ncbi:MAG: BamA/TamA family outer membrane protein [Gammaproteobacteria bacterium]|jgi:outer membrane protein assembly factor BamA|nr:BamA/TamA family outer membrane protein [Gammaproteobacteria bacterium]
MKLRARFSRIAFALQSIAGRVRFCPNPVPQTILCAGLIALFPTALLAEVQANSCSAIIERFEYEGNKVTRAEFLLQRSGLVPGQRLDSVAIERARQEIYDTGLFRKVEIRVDDLCQARTTVTIRVRERYYQLFYPRLSRNADGVIEKGWKYQGNNLFGADHTLEATISERDYQSGQTTQETKFNYDWPMLETPYDLRFSLSRTSSLVTEDEDITSFSDSFSFLVGRDWLSNPLGHPITILAKINSQHRYWDEDAPADTLGLGNYATLGLRLEYDDIHEEKYRRYGRFFAMEFNRGIYELGSDIDAAHFSLEARLYYRLNDFDNLNSRYLLSLASEDVFDSPNYSFGGAYTLRGIDSDEVTGNGLWQANIEYLKGFASMRNFRLAFFTDIGNVFDKYNQFNDHDWHQTVGLGLRWKIQSFVNTTLVIDYAHDPDSGFTKVYGGTSLIF